MQQGLPRFSGFSELSMPPSQTMQQRPSVSVGLPNASFSVLVLESRHLYRACHIHVPDSEKRLAAIQFQGKYYSFFKTEHQEARAKELCLRLIQKGDRAILTKTPKGFAIWAYEPQAQPISESSTAQSSAAEKNSTPSFKILASQAQYQPCIVQVPDLDKQLAAIRFEDRYYSLFKELTDINETVQLIKRLSARGDVTVVTKLAAGYGVWVLEPVAQAIA